MSLPLSPSLPSTTLPRIVAVGVRRINKMLQALAPDFAERAEVEVLDIGFDQAVHRIRAMQRSRPVDVVVSAGSNGAYLRQHLELPVVLVKVGGFDVMQALAQARRVSAHVALVTYEGMAPDLASVATALGLDFAQRTYRTEDEVRATVAELTGQGVEVVIGPGLVADLADQQGLTGVFLYSMDAVREALEDAVEVARASRIELAKRERLSTILGQLSDGVIAVDLHERVLTLNPAMAQWLGVTSAQWLGRPLSEACPELSLQATLRLGLPELEKIERVRGKTLIVNRMPIVEQGLMTGAVLTCQDPISIQRVDRQIRARTKLHAPGARYELEQFVGEAPAVVRLRELAMRCADSDATVLLVGESGTGKELIAQGIHMAGARRDMPFVAVNCGAMAESLLESELFGYEDGAFTGARRGGKAGLFEAAHRGTLFLDEIGDMPLSLQTRLLRVLQEQEVLRVGATEPTPIQVRVIAATHHDLHEWVAQGRFRLDLYYRLNILRLNVPPLRERLGDVPALAGMLHARLCRRLGVRPQDTVALLDAMLKHAGQHVWPGNVRELENLVERLVAYAGAQATPARRDHAVMADFLRLAAPELFAGQASEAPVAREAATPAPEAVPASWRARQAELERADILRAIEACGGDRLAACRRLGISRTTLWRKLR